jgi:hypothetical protein
VKEENYQCLPIINEKQGMEAYGISLIAPLLPKYCLSIESEPMGLSFVNGTTLAMHP